MFHEGVLVKFMKESNGQKLSVIHVDAHASDDWLINFYKLMSNITKPWLDNQSFLEFPKRVQFIYEFENLQNVSMNLIAQCTMLYFEIKKLDPD